MCQGTDFPEAQFCMTLHASGIFSTPFARATFCNYDTVGPSGAARPLRIFCPYLCEGSCAVDCLDTLALESTAEEWNSKDCRTCFEHIQMREAYGITHREKLTTDFHNNVESLTSKCAGLPAGDATSECFSSLSSQLNDLNTE